MPVYVVNEFDGKKTEGIGSVIQEGILSYSFAKQNGFCFSYPNISGLNHYQEFNITKEKFCNDVEGFFNIKRDIEYENLIKEEKFLLNDNITDFEIKNLLELNEKEKPILIRPSRQYLINNYLKKNIDSIQQEEILLGLKKDIFLEQKYMYFDLNYKNISIHIRKKNNYDNSFEPVRELYNVGQKNRILNTLKNGLKFFKNNKIKIHVYSQGQMEDLFFIKDLEEDTIEVMYHLNEYPTTSLYHMIHCDLLIMSNSSFSWISHLIGNQITFVRDNFYHVTYNKNKFFFDLDGNLK